MVVRDDPRYYPYRYGGRNVVADRPAHPGPRFVFRDADPRHPAVSRGEVDGRRTEGDDPGRTSEDVGGRGTVPAPRPPSLRARDRDRAPALAPARPLTGERRRTERRREQGPEEDDTSRESPGRRRPAPDAPQSTGEPELRRRRP